MTVGVCERVNLCLSLCGPAMSWRLVQGVTPPSLFDSWDWLQQTPEILIS